MVSRTRTRPPSWGNRPQASAPAAAAAGTARPSTRMHPAPAPPCFPLRLPSALLFASFPLSASSPSSLPPPFRRRGAGLDVVFSFPSRPSGLRINPRDRGAADQNPEGREVTTRPDSVNRVRPPPSQLPGGTTPGTGWHVPSSAPTPVPRLSW